MSEPGDGGEESDGGDQAAGGDQVAGDDEDDGAGEADESEAVAAARERVVAAIEQSAAEYGLPRSAGRIYGLLYFAEEPLSLDDLAERSGYAKSTVSDVTGTLEDLYFVRRVTPPEGGRKAYFEAERDLWYATQRVVEDAGRRELRLMRRALSSAEAELEDVQADAGHDGDADDAGTADAQAGDAQADDAAEQLERVRELQETYRQFAVVLDLLEQLPVERMLAILSRFVDDVDPEEFSAEDAPGDELDLGDVAGSRSGDDPGEQ